MHPTDSCVPMGGSQSMELFWTALQSLGGGALLADMAPRGGSWISSDTLIFYPLLASSLMLGKQLAWYPAARPSLLWWTEPLNCKPKEGFPTLTVLLTQGQEKSLPGPSWGTDCDFHEKLDPGLRFTFISAQTTLSSPFTLAQTLSGYLNMSCHTCVICMWVLRIWTPVLRLV